MDAQTCLKKLQYVGVLDFATVGPDGAPQVRCISAIHYEPDALYFFTARGKGFCKQLLRDSRVQILAYTRFKEMIRVTARAVPVPDGQQGQICLLYTSDILLLQQGEQPPEVGVQDGIAPGDVKIGQPAVYLADAGDLLQLS